MLIAHVYHSELFKYLDALNFCVLNCFKQTKEVMLDELVNI